MLQTRPEDLAVARKPVAFGDLRGWIAALKAQGELAEIAAEVDWNIELGTIMRLAQGAGIGKALIFNNIKDYNTPASRCRRIFGSALNNYRRIAMMLGLPPDSTVILFDDVTTKGGSVMKAVRAVRARGARVAKIITLVDRLEGARENLGNEGIELVALYTTQDLLG